MKICYVANSRFPSERAHMTQIVAMCNAFIKNGHEVTLFVTDRPTYITEKPEEFFGVPILFQIIRISVPDIAGRSPKIPAPLRPYLFFIQRIFFAYRAAKKIKHDCACTHVYGRDEWILWMLTHIISLPVMWESHEAKYSFVAKRLIAKIKKVVVISEGIRDFYRSHGVGDEKLLVAHDAVDERFFAPYIEVDTARKNLLITTQKPVVMYIGGFETWKGLLTLLEASKSQDVFETYVIGGKEHEIASYRRTYPHVLFLGSKPYSELPMHQQAADILVLPNTSTSKISSEYTSPLKLFTYMTSGRPIVASRTASIMNVLSDNEAYFFTPDDPNDLRNVIIGAIQNPQDAKGKADSAYQKSKRYTWVNRAREIVDFTREEES